MIHTDGTPTIAMRESDKLLCCGDPGDCSRPCIDEIAESTLTRPFFDGEGNEGTVGEAL